MNETWDTTLGVRELDERTRVIDMPAVKRMDPATEREIEDIFARAFAEDTNAERPQK